VWNDLAEELVETLVDALRLDGLPEHAGSGQQKLRDLGFARELQLVHVRTVVEKGAGIERD
jgi:hypothetical protein